MSGGKRPGGVAAASPIRRRASRHGVADLRNDADRRGVNLDAPIAADDLRTDIGELAAGYRAELDGVGEIARLVNGDGHWRGAGVVVGDLGGTAIRSENVDGDVAAAGVR